MTNDAYDLISQIIVPTSSLVGENNILMPIENSRILAETTPNANIIMFVNVGHNFTTGKEKRLAKVIDGFSQESKKYNKSKHTNTFNYYYMVCVST